MIKSVVLALIFLQTLVSVSHAGTLTESVMDPTIMSEEEGKSLILPSLMYGESRAKWSFQGEKEMFKNVTQGYGLTFIYGTSETTSVGVDAAWIHFVDDEENDDGGFQDVDVFLRNKVKMNKDLDLFPSVALSISPGDSGPSNNYTGGHSIVGQLNARRYLGSPSALVASTSVRLKGTQKYTNAFGTDRRKGGHEIQVNAGGEVANDRSRVGLTAGVLKITKSQNIDSSGFEYESSEGDYLIVQSYGILQMNPQLQVIPKVKYLSLLDKNQSVEENRIILANITLGVSF